MFKQAFPSRCVKQNIIIEIKAYVYSARSPLWLTPWQVLIFLSFPSLELIFDNDLKLTKLKHYFYVSITNTSRWINHIAWGFKYLKYLIADQIYLFWLCKFEI